MNRIKQFARAVGHVLIIVFAITWGGAVSLGVSSTVLITVERIVPSIILASTQSQ